MDEFDQAAVHRLRSLARAGATTSQMLRQVLHECAPTVLHKIPIIQLMREAFALSIKEAAPVVGWCGVGEGELSDAQLDEFVDPEIRRHRSEWDQARAG